MSNINGHHTEFCGNAQEGPPFPVWGENYIQAEKWVMQRDGETDLQSLDV